MFAVNRDTQIEAFLAQAGWQHAVRKPLAGDASARRYIRLTDADGKTRILMDADPTNDEDIRPFSRIQAHLSASGFSVPVVFQQDATTGLMLLEDFGDAVFASVMTKDPILELPLYQLAAEALARLHRKPLPDGLAPRDHLALAEMIAPAFEFYAPNAAAFLPRARSAFAKTLKPVAATKPVLCLRDFHAENMIWLPERQGDRRVGLLDFQDAFGTHPAYDLVSMLQDARRDLGAGVEATVIAHFIALTKVEETQFRFAYAALGAQRNLRILGVFSRLAMLRAKPQYLALQPRVWAHLQTNLAQTGMERIREALAELPAPEDVT